jgi:hypothetical protein
MIKLNLDKEDQEITFEDGRKFILNVKFDDFADEDNPYGDISLILIN